MSDPANTLPLFEALLSVLEREAKKTLEGLHNAMSETETYIDKLTTIGEQNLNESLKTEVDELQSGFRERKAWIKHLTDGTTYLTILPHYSLNHQASCLSAAKPASPAREANLRTVESLQDDLRIFKNLIGDSPFPEPAPKFSTGTFESDLGALAAVTLSTNSPLKRESEEILARVREELCDWLDSTLTSARSGIQIPDEMKQLQ